MKTEILSATFALLSMAGYSFDKTQPSEKEIMVQDNYKKIMVGENIKLVLVPADKNTNIFISGNQDKLNNISVKENNDQIIISSKQSIKQESIVVYVPVKELSFIELKKGAILSGQGDLTFNDLTVLVNVDSRMELKLKGNVKIKEAEDCYFIYE